jgi:riboflavin kinase/FMN adenylyltransferase
VKVFYNTPEFKSDLPVVLTPGTFDGVHLGHQTILNRLNQAAQERQATSVVMTYHPHPRYVLFPEENNLKLLQTLDEKIHRLEKSNIDALLIIPFTREFSQKSSAQFIQEILVDTLAVKHIIIGYDHQFGQDRKGGLAELQSASPTFGFTVEEIPAQEIDNSHISSTRIRKALANGEVELANTLLGYPYELGGIVVHGDHRGRLLGFPTANVKPENETKLIPATGVYAVEAQFLDQTWPGMLNIGFKPTFGGKAMTIEVHLFNFNLDLYDQFLRIRFFKRIRAEQKFDGLDALVKQLEKDQQTALRYFGIN